MSPEDSNNKDNHSASPETAEQVLAEVFLGNSKESQEVLLEPSENKNSVQSILDAPKLSLSAECSKCGKPTYVVCPTCKGPFCEEHTSILDNRYCNLCLAEKDAEIQVLPLKSPDGVQHDGHLLKPSGPAFGTLSKRISEMSDYELEAHIQYYQELVRQAERSLDFRRVVLGASQIESTQRKDAKARALRISGYKAPRKVTSADGKVTAKAKPDATTSMANALNLSPDALNAILGVLTTKPKGK